MQKILPRAVIVAVLPDEVCERARRTLSVRFARPDATPPAALSAMLEAEQAEALLISARTRMDPVAIAALPERLRILATCSVGVDHIDLVAARARGLVVSNTPDVLTDATADLAVFLLLAASRRAADHFRLTSAGWGRRLEMTELLGVGLAGKTLGLVGMGRIGRAVAHRARAFGMTIAYHNRNRLPADLENGARYVAGLDELLASSDMVSLHCPGQAGGAPLLTAARIGRLRPGAILINTARGGLVDEAALVEALASGRLFAAGLDVLAQEPAIDPAMLRLSNLVLTPHVGSATIETRNAMGHRALDNVAAVLAGRPAPDRVA